MNEDTNLTTTVDTADVPAPKATTITFTIIGEIVKVVLETQGDDPRVPPPAT